MPHRRSIRLRDYDYAQAEAYFVTIVAQGRECAAADAAVRGSCGCRADRWEGA